MTLHNVLVLCFVGAAFLTALFNFYVSLLNRIRTLEEYAAQLLDEKNTFAHENKMLAERLDELVVGHYALSMRRRNLHIQEPNA